MFIEIYFFVLLLFFARSSVGSVVEDDDETSLRHFDGDRNVTFKNGSSYSGHWANGMMDGEGVLQMTNGDIYRSTISCFATLNNKCTIIYIIFKLN